MQRSIDAYRGFGDARSVTTAPFQSDHTASFPLFDWLRFILASVVVLGHAGIPMWSASGNFAVQVFFALSGWLIGGILLRTERSGLPRFFFNRGTRIWLPYFAAVALLYGLAIARDGLHPEYARFLFYDLTFTHNWFIDKVPEVVSRMPLKGTGAHFWSIAVEEQFYLAAPLLIVLLPWGKTLALWLAIALAACATAGWYGSISLGVLAAVAQHRFGDWHLRARVPLVLLALTTALALAALPDSYPWLAPPLAIAIVLLAAVPGKRRALPVFLGGTSYPLYLNHWIGIFASHAMPIGTPLVVAFEGYVLAVCVGGVAYSAVDKQILRFRSGFFTPPRALVFARVAYGLMAIGIIGGVTMAAVTPLSSATSHE